MKFQEVLRPRAVRVLPGCNSKKRLLHDLADIAELAYGAPAGKVLSALLEREALGPTGVGRGVALPHARIDEIDALSAIFVLLPQPVEFEAVDRLPVDLVCCLLAPPSAGVEHLKTLALIARTFRDHSMCTKLRSNPDPTTIFTILTEDAVVTA